VINPDVLLSDLKKLLGQLEGDLRERADEVPALSVSLRSAYERAKQAERTAQPFETWREEYLTQAAVAWVLACVFVRFIEDNGLIDTPLLAGVGPGLDRAKDQRTLYFQQHPTDSDREYLHYAIRKVKALPAAAPLFDERHNPLWAVGVSGDGATLLVELLHILRRFGRRRLERGQLVEGLHGFGHGHALLFLRFIAPTSSGSGCWAWWG
jgi:hypothetical protein